MFVKIQFCSFLPTHPLTSVWTCVKFDSWCAKINTKTLFWKTVAQKLMRVEIKINKVSFRNQTTDWKYCWKQYLILNNCWLECKFLYLLIFFVINCHMPVSSITERFSQLNSTIKKWINYSFPSFFFP